MWVSPSLRHAVRGCYLSSLGSHLNSECVYYIQVMAAMCTGNAHFQVCFENHFIRNRQRNVLCSEWAGRSSGGIFKEI